MAHSFIDDNLVAAIKFASVQSKGLETLSFVANKIFKPPLTSFNLENLINKVLDWFSLPFLQLETSDIEISNNAEGQTVQSDPSLVSLVFFNMLYSALKDQTRDSKIHVTVLSKKEEQSLTVDKIQEESTKLVDSSKALVGETMNSKAAKLDHQVIFTLDYSTKQYSDFLDEFPKNFEDSDLELQIDQDESEELYLITNRILCRALKGSFRYFSERGLPTKRIEASFTADMLDVPLITERAFGI